MSATSDVASGLIEINRNQTESEFTSVAFQDSDTIPLPSSINILLMYQSRTINRPTII